MHTLIGVLGTGTVEGAITTGSVALSAPILNKISQQAIKILIDQGVSPQIAKNAVDLVSSLGIATITQLAGAETASTAMAVNVDAFNRQLHNNELIAIKELSKKYAEQLDIDQEEAEKRLIRGALYNTDANWQKSIDKYAAEEIESYQQAYNFLLAETKDISIVQYNALIREKQLQQSQIQVDCNQTSPCVILPTTVVTTSTNPYLGEVGKGFTASAEDFNNQRLFLKELFSDKNSLSAIMQYAAVNDPRTYGRIIDRTEVWQAKAEGSKQGVKNFIFAPIEATENIIDAIQNPRESLVSIIDGIKNMPKNLVDSYENLTYKGYEDNLAIIQGDGLQVIRNDAKNSTQLGMGIGLATVIGNPVSLMSGIDVDKLKVDLNWNAGWAIRGKQWEDELAKQLPSSFDNLNKYKANFKTFDFYDRTTQTAISAKSIDTVNSFNHANGVKSLERQIKGYVDSVLKFEADRSNKNQYALTKDDIKHKEIYIAIPQGTSPEKIKAIENTTNYGTSKGVKVIVIITGNL